MMDLREDFRCGWRIARTEVRRSVRWYFQQPRAKIGLALILLVFGAILLFVVIPGAYALGTTVRVEEQFPLLAALRQQMTVLLGTLIVLFAVRTIERLAHIDGEKLMLTTTTPRAVVIGLLTAETIRLLLWFGIPAFFVVTAFAIGAQTPALFITVPIGLAPLLAFAAVIGYLLGLGVMYASQYVPLSSAIKTILYPLVLVVFIVGSQLIPRLVLNDTLPVSLAPIGHALLQSPLASYADVFLLGTPVAQPLSPMTGVVLSVFLVGIPVGFTAAGRLAARFWTTETSEYSSSPKETTETTPTSVPHPFSWSKSGRIAWQYLRSGLRSPRQFIHIVFLLFAFAPALTTFFESPDLAYIFALGGSIVFGALLAGSTFGLNPFGDEQRTLPLLLLTATPPKQLIRGRIVAGLTACFPFVVVIPFAVAVAGPQSIVEVGGFVIVGLVVAVVSAMWAVGLGTMFPKYESRKMYGVESVVPSYFVLFGHNFSVVIVGLVSLILIGFVLAQGILSSGIVLAGIAVALVVLIGTALWAYIYAVRQYRNYSLDV